MNVRRRPPLAVIQGGKGRAMTLTWSDYPAVADALATAHPQADLINLGREALRQMVVALPDFHDDQEPEDPEILDAILYAWIALGAEGEEAQPDD